jgi:hypothetical protein
MVGDFFTSRQIWEILAFREKKKKTCGSVWRDLFSSILFFKKNLLVHPYWAIRLFQPTCSRVQPEAFFSPSATNIFRTGPTCCNNVEPKPLPSARRRKCPVGRHGRHVATSAETDKYAHSSVVFFFCLSCAQGWFPYLGAIVAPGTTLVCLPA